MKKAQINKVESIKNEKGVSFDVTFNTEVKFRCTQNLSEVINGTRFLGGTFPETFISLIDETDTTIGNFVMETRDMNVTLEFLMAIQEGKIDVNKCFRETSIDVENILNIITD